MIVYKKTFKALEDYLYYYWKSGCSNNEARVQARNRLEHILDTVNVEYELPDDTKEQEIKKQEIINLINKL